MTRRFHPVAHRMHPGALPHGSRWELPGIAHQPFQAAEALKLGAERRDLDHEFEVLGLQRGAVRVQLRFVLAYQLGAGEMVEMPRAIGLLRVTDELGASRIGLEHLPVEPALLGELGPVEFAVVAGQGIWP